MMGEAERGDGRIAAHEADQGPLDMPGKAEPRGDELVDPGRDEAGAAGDDEMGDAVERDLAREVCDRRQRQLGRGLGIDLHPLAGGRQPRMVEAARARPASRRPGSAAAPTSAARFPSARPCAGTRRGCAHRRSAAPPNR